ncbi:glycoside hydrolase family 26 protein [Pontibacter chitinilyticus]|uniref:glycoside hydrolase family 26 protein n=1 Tax=Pontibacter chitinilyticus TaxID=2674989 RepID=UPI00321B0E4F
MTKLLPFLLLPLLAACGTRPTTQADLNLAKQPKLGNILPLLVDRQATPETAALFYSLKKIAQDHILFGHQASTTQGYGWWYEPNRSDIKEVTGRYPEVYGWDFIDIASFKPADVVEKAERTTRENAIAAYERGGINTFSWHYSNPVTEGSFYWEKSPTQAVSAILPGGSAHEKYKNSLKEIAAFNKTLVSNGMAIPIIFRPFHEFDGEWFWWGKPHSTAQEYKDLYRFTVTYLRDSLNVRNFLYAWSPDCRFKTETEYLERYPGDAYVDLVGTDDYFDLYEGKDPAVAASKFKIVSDFAKAHHKVGALTETGLKNVAQADWFTQMLLKALQQQKIELAYVLLWANRKDEYWTPYKGHPAEQDFIQFTENPYILMENDVQNIYTLDKTKLKK